MILLPKIIYLIVTIKSGSCMGFGRKLLLTLWSWSQSELEVVKTAAAPEPRATSIAPVRVARSTMARGLKL